MDNILDYVRTGDDCWTWARGHDGRGYSIVHVAGKCHKVHIILYQMTFGPVPDGKELHHTCENKGCVRPMHLQPVTRSEHVRITNALKGQVTHCIHGHPFDEANTYHYKGMRFCRACNQRRTVEKRQRQRALKIQVPE